MATLGSLIISLEANTAKFESAMTKAQYTAKKSSDVIKSSLLEIGGALVAAFSLAKLEDAITGIAKMEGSLLKMAGRLNTSVETLSSFGVMMRKTGMDSDAFYTALTRLEKGMSAAGIKAEESTGKFDEEGEEIMKAAGAYDELGLKVNVLMKMPLDQQLMAIAQAFKENIDPADRVRIAMELFGKGGAGMVNILKGGAADIQKWIAEQTNLGIVTDEAAKKAAEFNNETKNLTVQWENFKREILEGVIPALGQLIGKINQAISESRQMREITSTYEKHFPGKLEYSPAMGLGPYGEAAGEPGIVSPVPYKPPAELTKPPVRPAGLNKGGGGGGRGGGDLGLDRMTSIIDTLQKDLSRLTEGSLAEIKSWADKVRNEIDKVGRKGADTERALSMVAEVESAKKKKAFDDYELFVAKESGNAYKQIEADARDWLNKYKGFADAEVNINAIKKRKIWEEETKQQGDRLSMQRSYLDSISSEMPLLSQRLAIKKRSLPIEIKMMQLEQQRRLATMQISEAQKEELKGLMALAIQAKKYGAAREEWSTQGTLGGLKIAAEDMRKSAETWAAEQTAALVKSLPSTLSNQIASSLVGFLQGKTPDLQQLGISMAQSFIQTMLEGILNQIIPDIVGGLTDALGGILGEIGGGGGGVGGIFGTIFDIASNFLPFHGGGLVTAHSGYLATDERLIKVQTGERVLSRQETRNYDRGRGAGGAINIVINAGGGAQDMDWRRLAKREIVPQIQRAINLGRLKVAT